MKILEPSFIIPSEKILTASSECSNRGNRSEEQPPASGGEEIVDQFVDPSGEVFLLKKVKASTGRNRPGLGIMLSETLAFHTIPPTEATIPNLDLLLSILPVVNRNLLTNPRDVFGVAKWGTYGVIAISLFSVPLLLGRVRNLNLEM